MEYFLDMPSCFAEAESAKYVLIPVPYDGTSTYIKGADKGPQAIIDASDSIELYDIQTNLEAYRSGIYTDKPPYPSAAPEKMMVEVKERVSFFLQQNKKIGLLGGEHSISIGAIEAFAEKYPNLSVLQIDAHADLRDSYNGSIYNHACVMRRAQEVANVVQVGIRSVCIEEKNNIIPENMFYAHDICGKTDWMQKAIDRLTEHVYLTIDLDGFDPSIVPATGTPLPGGLLWYETLAFLELLFKSKKVVGFDVVELCPQNDNKISDVLAAVLVYKIISFMEKYGTFV
ncbi:MAG: agmatinase [Bacteroidetes bacterium]|nr:agmatinase [Bacteroidota bacterium]MCL2303493.1 agmatinase [Lentimicrobiaceae bacterium]